MIIQLTPYRERLEIVAKVIFIKEKRRIKFMNFTVMQLIIMFLIAYVCLYALIDRVMKCIEHCATARAYGRFREAGTMIKNKIYGMVFIVLGALTIPIEWDATFFLFTLMLSILLFVSRENCIMN